MGQGEGADHRGSREKVAGRRYEHARIHFMHRSGVSLGCLFVVAKQDANGF